MKGKVFASSDGKKTALMVLTLEEGSQMAKGIVVINAPDELVDCLALALVRDDEAAERFVDSIEPDEFNHTRAIADSALREDPLS